MLLRWRVAEMPVNSTNVAPAKKSAAMILALAAQAKNTKNATVPESSRSVS
jgi:hypothetical protein